MEEYDINYVLRTIPSVNEILEHPKVVEMVLLFGRSLVIESIKSTVEEYRKDIIINEKPEESCENRTREEAVRFIVEKLEEKLENHQNSGMKKVINATGIVLHTNLGRAPLPKKALLLIQEVCEGYSNLEFDLKTGERGSRHSHIEPLIKKLTGAESALVVNNNAAAVFLALNTLANNKEVIVSRGQQVEIGGSFRIPDIIKQSGGKMVEVGTTNKTRISDYENAIRSETSVILKVHTSNFKVTGFTEEVTLSELVEMSKATEIAELTQSADLDQFVGSVKSRIGNNLVIMEDLGSGSLYDLSMIGLTHEPTVQESIKAGADIVTFSGDKLLGGPQAGIIAGKKQLIDKIKRNPLARVVRSDKTTIAAITAILSLYMDLDNVLENIPVLKMLALKVDELTERAIELENLIHSESGTMCSTEIVDELDQAGGGSLPGVILKGKAVALTIPNFTANEIQEKLRKAKIPIICRIHKDRILINVRTLEKKDYPTIAEAIDEILKKR